MLHSLRQPNSTDKPTVTKLYGIGGEVKSDDDHCLAKSCTIKGNTKYYCKFNTYGVEAGHLVNPWSMYAEDASIFKNTTVRRTGKQLREYQEVNERVFDLYTRYLQSQSDVHYRQAERLALEND